MSSEANMLSLGGRAAVSPEQQFFDEYYPRRIFLCSLTIRSVYFIKFIDKQRL
jgi:hypothetical protein